MDGYKVLKSEKKYSGRIVDIMLDDISLPNGKITKREVVERGGAAAVVAVDDDGQILLVRQYRHPIRAMSLEIPAGVLDSEHEDPKDCALRELEEETGYRAQEISFLTKFYTAIGFCTELLHIYLAKNLEESVQNLDEDEIVTLCRYPLQEAIDMIYSGEIVDSKTMVGLLAYKDIISKKA